MHALTCSPQNSSTDSAMESPNLLFLHTHKSSLGYYSRPQQALWPAGHFLISGKMGILSETLDSRLLGYLSMHLRANSCYGPQQASRPRANLSHFLLQLVCYDYCMKAKPLLLDGHLKAMPAAHCSQGHHRGSLKSESRRVLLHLGYSQMGKLNR